MGWNIHYEDQIVKASKIITYTTDFGSSDPYAGIMKGIVLSINPKACQVDITHNIPSHDIVHASFILANAYSHFPKGTIHTAIVDPGVGGERKNIAVLTDSYFFVGPDNGIFSNVLSNETIREIREIKNLPFIMETVSSTFHGRDVFAPCAGFISAGKNFSDIGPLLERVKYLDFPKIKKENSSLTGEVVFIDSFGNLITNISQKTLDSFAGDKSFEIYFAAERFTKLSTHYSEIPSGKALALFGSTEHLEISMNGGSAASYFMTPIGTKITIQLI
ncbi:S-adenosyl-l-methionine hydroxide adenosyltransferase family protein [Candidatus Latescibacterota bacterium]